MRIKSLTQYSAFLFVSIGCGLVYGWPEQEYEGPAQQVYEHPRHTGPMPDMQRGNRQNPRQLSETRAQPQNTEFERQYSQLVEQLQAAQAEKTDLEVQKSELVEQLQKAQEEKAQLEVQKSELAEQLQKAQEEKAQQEGQKSELAGQLQAAQAEKTELEGQKTKLAGQLQKAQAEKTELEGQRAERDERIRTITLIAVSCALLIVLIFGIFKRMNRARAMYKQSQDDKNAMDEEELRCPYCGWKHKATDEVCKNCHTRF